MIVAAVADLGSRDVARQTPLQLLHSTLGVGCSAFGVFFFDYPFRVRLPSSINFQNSRVLPSC